MLKHFILYIVVVVVFLVFKLSVGKKYQKILKKLLEVTRVLIGTITVKKMSCNIILLNICQL